MVDMELEKGLKEAEIMGLVYKTKFRRDKHNISLWSPRMGVDKNKIGDYMV